MLGNFTKEVQAAAVKAVENRRPLSVRVDGPYGQVPFDATKHASIVFVCGGVGVTPVIGFLRTLFELDWTTENYVKSSSDDHVWEESEKRPDPSGVLRDVHVIWSVQNEVCIWICFV